MPELSEIETKCLLYLAKNKKIRGAASVGRFLWPETPWHTRAQTLGMRGAGVMRRLKEKGLCGWDHTDFGTEYFITKTGYEMAMGMKNA